MAATGRPLHRSRRQRMVAGVCGGFAEWLGWDVTLVRTGATPAALATPELPD